MNNVKDNIRFIKHRIEQASLAAGRNPNDVKLMLATKTVPDTIIAEALGDSHMLIGENKIQELKAKHSLLFDKNVAFHFIGHLQTNKIKEAVRYADCIESVDRMDLVEKLDKRLQHEGKSMDIMLQINTSYEESKFGMNPEKAISFAREVSGYDTLNVKGLMTIGLFSAEEEKVRKCFRLLKNIQKQIEELGLPNFAVDDLSMGMSGDFEIAIQEGATIVRIGTAIFGSRIYPDSYYWNENKDIL